MFMLHWKATLLNAPILGNKIDFDLRGDQSYILFYFVRLPVFLGSFLFSPVSLYKFVFFIWFVALLLSAAQQQPWLHVWVRELCSCF